MVAKSRERKMAKVLVHITVGPENPTKAALAFLVAKSVIEEGHELALFVAGDGVHLISSAAFGTIEGVGTGRLSDHITALNSHHYLAFYSGMSAKARSIGSEHIVLKGAEPAMPARLVQLTTEYDKVFCY
jgi:predicted peroxiredoxin